MSEIGQAGTWFLIEDFSYIVLTELSWEVCDGIGIDARAAICIEAQGYALTYQLVRGLLAIDLLNNYHLVYPPARWMEVHGDFSSWLGRARIVVGRMHAAPILRSLALISTTFRKRYRPTE